MSKVVKRDVPLQEVYVVVVSAISLAHCRKNFSRVSVPVRVDSSRHLLSIAVLPKVIAIERMDQFLPELLYAVSRRQVDERRAVEVTQNQTEVANDVARVFRVEESLNEESCATQPKSSTCL